MNKKRLLSVILSLCMIFIICGTGTFNVFADTSSPTIPSDNLKVKVGDTIYPHFSVASGKMVYNYTVTDPSGSTVASRTFSVQNYQSPS